MRLHALRWHRRPVCARQWKAVKSLTSYLPLAYHETTFQSQNYNQIFVLQCLDQGLRHRLQKVSRVNQRNQNKIGFLGNLLWEKVCSKKNSLRKQPPFCDATACFLAKWRGTSEEIPYLWRITIQIWDVLLIGSTTRMSHLWKVIACLDSSVQRK